ncbi:hypothetical protein XENTR_v10011327 [Xenopus tropicalis]|nr:hypothetical protein XENTR_v10011327 [Xenopus tropicalis]
MRRHAENMHLLLSLLPGGCYYFINWCFFHFLNELFLRKINFFPRGTLAQHYRSIALGSEETEQHPYILSVLTVVAHHPKDGTCYKAHCNKDFIIQLSS